MSLPVSDPLRDLAAQIYVEIVGRAVVLTDNTAQMKSNPEGLAKLSFKLAQAFQNTGVDVKTAEAPPVGKFDVQLSDIAGWNK